MTTPLATCLVVLLALAPVPAGATVPSIEYTDGRLTAHLEGADLTDVLRQVAQQAGLEVRGGLTAPQPVSVDLDAVPLADALPRLLGAQSFLLTYGRGGRLKGVTLLGSSDATSWLVPPPASGAPAEAADTEVSGSLAASHRPVPIGGRLARAVGSEQTSFSEIMGVAMRDPSARVRADALRVGLRILDAEPELRSDFLRALDGMDDSFIAGWLVRVAGEHAEEIVRRAARSTRSGSLRLRAEAVERLFRSGVAGGANG
jgi:hypothetical protein